MLGSIALSLTKSSDNLGLDASIVAHDDNSKIENIAENPDSFRKLMRILTPF